MKIIYLSTARIPDEWAHVIQIMKSCDAFAKQGADVTLLVPRRAHTSKANPFTIAGVEENFTIKRLPCIDLFPGTQSRVFFWLRTFSFLFFARLYLFTHAADIVYTRELHVWAPLSHTVFELHTVNPSIVKTIPRLRKARGTVVITEGIRTELSLCGFRSERVLVAPDAVDPSEFAFPESREEARKRLGVPMESTAIFYIGLLDAWKGADVLYEAAKLLAPAITTVIIGEGETPIEELKKRHPEILFLGFLPYRELANNMAAADVLILPNSGKSDISAKFTSPLKLFAYMTSGIPIVASRLPSIGEILSEENAFLATPDDAGALAEQVRYVVTHPEEAGTRAVRAKQDVLKYTWEDRAKSILEFVK
jgi:glycosyltransferase involved in cell wall biosynthesis